MKDKKRIVGLFLIIIMVCLLVIPKVANAISSPVYLYDIEGDFEELYDENPQNEAGTAIYDETSGTLTLNNYHGSSIEILLDTDLTIILKGENVITAGEDECGIITFLSGGITITGDGSLQINNGEEGLSIQSSKLQIDSGNITITDATKTGISVFGDLIINGGNIVINHTGEDKIPIGIMSMNKIIINGGNIKIDADEMGIYTYYDYTKINDGKVIVNADHVGILAGGLLSIQGDYLEINTPNNNTSAALAVDSADISALDIASDLVISNKEVTKQAILLAPEYTVSLITLGKDGASASAEDGMSDLVTSNVANSIKIYKTHKLSFDKNGGSGQMADVTDLAGIYTLPKNEFTAPSGKRFKGWSLTKNGAVINTLDVEEDVTLYAIWEVGNPNTGDNINTFATISIISLVGILGSTIIFRKRFN